ncbi:GNAT family N-acetyltransferase [Hazenella sp. IB182357]|uniref:GNAT family N-acetyltransferase n=1 Tax=Polycladospora coralii TaxID=2771432 RepID=A0A926RYH5_9BACL|nr:GNAT family protein [Polycladospora coralii]MBD1373516.1 GNAT family N-acetyltransferase [Polycladospora coralii]MBS7531884.1 GNAT family N-acetyltransferase [Polycladospora coralii]
MKRYHGNRIYLRSFHIEDARQCLMLMEQNRDLFQRFVPTREESFYTIEKQKAVILKRQYAMKEDTGYAYGIFLLETDQLIGEINLNRVFREPHQRSTMGYCLDQAHQAQGYATEAVLLLLDIAFTELCLHRIEAGVQPTNIGSIRVLEKAGFKREGLARKNVRINGSWTDHLMFAILAEDGWNA